MPAQRIKAQEVSLVIVRDGALEAELVDIKNFNLAFQSETKIQGYIGEKSSRTDDVFNNVKFDFEMHIHSTDWGAFQRAIIDRQQRKTPDLQINISAVFFFPNGQTQTINIQDAKFGELPVTVPERGDYVSLKLDGVADTAEIVDQ